MKIIPVRYFDGVSNLHGDFIYLHNSYDSFVICTLFGVDFYDSTNSIVYWGDWY